MIWSYLLHKWCYVYWMEIVRPEVVIIRLCLLAVWLHRWLRLLCIIVTVSVQWQFMFTKQLEIRTLRQGITIVILWTILHFYSVKVRNVQCLHCSVRTEREINTACCDLKKRNTLDTNLKCRQIIYDCNKQFLLAPFYSFYIQISNAIAYDAWLKTLIRIHDCDKPVYKFVCLIKILHKKYQIMLRDVIKVMHALFS